MLNLGGVKLLFLDLEGVHNSCKNEYRNQYKYQVHGQAGKMRVNITPTLHIAKKQFLTYSKQTCDV